jgi:hypothetical protein
MLQISVILDGPGAWPDLDWQKVVHVAEDGPPVQVAVFAKGMVTGRPSVVLRMDLPDGQTVLAQTSARLFCSAARIVMAQYPDLFRDH